MFYCLIAVISFVLSMVATRVVRDFASKYGLVSNPSSDRHVHRAAVPRLGGIGIFITVATVCVVRELTLYHVRHSADINILRLIAILVAGAIVFAIGLVDDLRSVRPYSKIIAQVFSASIFFLSNPHLLHINSLLGSRYVASLASLLTTIAWVVLVSNGFNLIDGLDGLAAGSALCSTATLFIVSLWTRHSFITLINSSLGGSILGFLVFNFSPASIFLGDCGSLFLGVVLAESSLTLQDQAPFVLGMLLPLCCFALPLLDTVLAIFRRILNCRPVFSADGEHIHHKLLERGLSQRQVVLLLCSVSALSSCLLAILIHLNAFSRNFLVAALAITLFSGLIQLRYREFHELHRIARRIAIQRRIVKNDLALRRATERLQTQSSIEGVCHELMSVFEQTDFDGFQLQLHNLPQNSRGLFPWRDNRQFAFEWQKSNFDDRTDGGPNCRIQLDLQSSGQFAGALTVYRHSADRPFLVDLDILTNELRKTLADAIQRLFCDSESQFREAKQYRTAGVG